MKILVIATVLTLLIVTPAMAVEDYSQAGTLLVASKNDGGSKPVVIIKGEGGKVKDVKKKKKKK